MNMAGKVKLRSSDGMVFKADVEAVMACSGVLRNLIEDVGTDATIPVPEVEGRSLKYVIEYCESMFKFDFEFVPIAPTTVDPLTLQESECFLDTSGSLACYDSELLYATTNGRESREDKRWDAGTKRSATVINDDQETQEDERSWEKKEYDASFINEVCIDWKTIKALHEVTIVEGAIKVCS